jgi:hypothetical protein
MDRGGEVQIAAGPRDTPPDPRPTSLATALVCRISVAAIPLFFLFTYEKAIQLHEQLIC